jgi:hypothetical protein
LHRHASLSLALCDQLNTPLQTLIGVVSTLPPSAATAQAASRIEQLRDSSQELTNLVDALPPELQRASFDSAVDLKRRT